MRIILTILLTAGIVLGVTSAFRHSGHECGFHRTPTPAPPAAK